MLLMFIVGTGSVGWMLALGALMGLEKNLVGGWLAKHIGTMIGIALFSMASIITMKHVLA
jgi:predicted metal-binding membrane protein